MCTRWSHRCRVQWHGLAELDGGFLNLCVLGLELVDGSLSAPDGFLLELNV
jgi:hypothetical protein